MNGDGASCRARGTSLGTTRAIRGRDALRFVAKRILWATFAGQLTTSICVRGKATEEENRGRKQRKKTEEEQKRVQRVFKKCFTVSFALTLVPSNFTFTTDHIFCAKFSEFARITECTPGGGRRVALRTGIATADVIGCFPGINE
jgi:hypothetical protein